MLLRGQRTGLLGGSFNPAHEGHIHICVEAAKRLNLQRVVWLVSPQNPLKEKQGMAPYEQRLNFARHITRNIPLIEVSDIEQREKLFYSCDTIAHLHKHHPRTPMVWLMGADNWQQFHRWRNWQKIMHSIPIAVCDRAPLTHQALHSKAAIRYRASRVTQHELCTCEIPAWQFLFLPRHPLSATQLRNSLGADAFSVAY